MFCFDTVTSEGPVDESSNAEKVSGSNRSSTGEDKAKVVEADVYRADGGKTKVGGPSIDLNSGEILRGFPTDNHRSGDSKIVGSVNINTDDSKSAVLNNVAANIVRGIPVDKPKAYDTSEFKETLDSINNLNPSEELRPIDYGTLNVFPYTQGATTGHPLDSVLRQKVVVSKNGGGIVHNPTYTEVNGRTGKKVDAGGATTADNGLLNLNTDGTPTYDVKPVRENLGNGMFRYKVLVNGKEMSADDALEKKLIDQKQHEEITKQNSIVDRSQETASNRMRDMWIRKGEKMSDWWKRLDDEQKMGLIGGGFLGGGLLLSNMNKKKRGLGDYISHYGIPAAIAGLSVYGGSAWNADENTYNLDRYNYLMQQAQPQQPNTTATA